MARSGVVNVYIKEVGPRASWIFKLIFEDLLGKQLTLTNDMSVVASGETAALNYSNENIPGVPCITPHGLLSEKGIREQNIQLSEFNGLPVFFPVVGGDMPFDPFAVSFYLVSRYEEHLPFEADSHGRFLSASSLAYREGFLDKALVNRMAFLVRDLISDAYPTAEFPSGEYKFLPTIDIDIAFAHLGKGFVRTYGAMAKHLMKGKIREIRDRVRSMRGQRQDPFDNFDLINSSCADHDLKPLYFILAGDPGAYDRNLSVKNKDFADLIRKLRDAAELGVHPSYGSDNDPERLKEEVRRIQSISGATIQKSRQHYVRLHFPDTYAMLIKNNINEDYSMGYADISGFRASIATPFKYYDLSAEKETTLTVVPFMFMDTSLSDYLGLAPEQYPEAVMPIIEEVKACRGTLTAIWHNYALADDEAKHKAFKEIIKLAAAI